jgi:hypothetical protein
VQVKVLESQQELTATRLLVTGEGKEKRGREKCDKHVYTAEWIPKEIAAYILSAQGKTD